MNIAVDMVSAKIPTGNCARVASLPAAGQTARHSRIIVLVTDVAFRRMCGQLLELTQYYFLPHRRHSKGKHVVRRIGGHWNGCLSRGTLLVRITTIHKSIFTSTARSRYYFRVPNGDKFGLRIPHVVQDRCML